MKLQQIRRASLFLALAGLAVAPGARADIAYGQTGDRTVCPDPTFNACYIGVDGSRVATVTMNSTSTFSFVGLGVQSSELGAVTFPGQPPTGATMPNGYLEVASGASLGINGTFNAARPYDASVFVGLGNNSTGTLFVNGGQVTTPVLVIGETDGVRASSGQVVLANSGILPVSRITATFDGSSAGPLSGFTAIQIGRGQGSSGDLSIGYGDAVAATAGSVSIGRAGTGTLEIGTNASLTTAGSVYAAAADPHGLADLSVAGTLGLGVGGRLLLGAAVDTATSGLDQGYVTTGAAAANHGTATLTLQNGVVDGTVVVGAGGTLQGNGHTGTVLDYGGYLSPGFSPGEIHVDGDFVMDGGTYLVQIAGTGAGMTDLIDVSGSANLSNATILFQFIDGFAPSAGFSFDYLDALGGVTTSNLTFAMEGLEPGFAFGTSQTEGGALRFTALSNGIPIPEPETLVLLAIGLAGATTIRRRRTAR